MALDCSNLSGQNAERFRSGHCTGKGCLNLLISSGSCVAGPAAGGVGEAFRQAGFRGGERATETLEEFQSQRMIVHSRVLGPSVAA